MEIERVISWFDKDTESLQGEFNMDAISLDDLKKIFNPPISDPLMYEPYTICPDHIELLSKIIDYNFDFNKYVYQLDCFQI